MGNFEHNDTSLYNFKNMVQGVSLSYPTDEQIESAKNLVIYLDTAYGIDYVGGHRNFALPNKPTMCPGNVLQEKLMPKYKGVYLWSRGD